MTMLVVFEQLNIFFLAVLESCLNDDISCV